MPETITVGEWDAQHPVGDAGCMVGWCAGVYGVFPHPCGRKECTGLMHAEFFEEDWDGYYLSTKCDVCGEPE